LTFARLVASGGGAGLLPRAPGTWGSLAAALAGLALLAAGGRLALGAGVVVATLAGLWAIPRAGGEADPGWVVIDEVAGMWLAMAPMAHPAAVPSVLAFALFRLLDITKPGPIGAIDRIPGRAGVMGDDLLAGAVVALLLWAAFAAGLPGG
jgi:phosphatidylglycerophosphatase A